jgi:di/tricarboxylate transporter
VQQNPRYVGQEAEEDGLFQARIDWLDMAQAAVPACLLLLLLLLLDARIAEPRHQDPLGLVLLLVSLLQAKQQLRHRCA